MRASRLCVPCVAVLFCQLALAAEARADTEKVYYAFELNGALVGYLEADIEPANEAGLSQIRTKLFAQLTVMGQPFDIKAVKTCQVEPTTHKVHSCDSNIEQGSMRMGATLIIEGDQLRFNPKVGGAARTISMEQGLIVDDPLHFPYLLTDFGPGQPDKREYRVFDDTMGQVQEVTITSTGTEKLRLAGSEYDCAVFDVHNHTNGINGKVWVNPENGRFLKAQLPNNGYLYLAEPAVVGKIRRAEVDDMLFARAPTPIADFAAISYMKIRAKINSFGESITPESLNVPGQKFSGTVKDNLVDGVFEIRHSRYDGIGAPAFPSPFADSEEFREFLEPETLIESDDPVLVAKAREITSGSKNSWEAACRLSEWVAEEIGYEIPGASARQTYDSRKGECGAHSRLLTALCRAVGIPARLATGCMYTPLYGGSFGQHAWNEIYMGDAGWIMVDSTAQEVDYVDSGHIRLGQMSSFNPQEMEVLDYKAGAMTKGKPVSGIGTFKNLPWEIGKTYTWRYIVNGTPIGTDSFTLKSHETQDGTRIYTATFKLDLQGMSATGEWQIDDQGTPLDFAVKGQASAMEYSIDCEFSKDQVTEKVVKAGTPIERTIPLTEKIYLIDNNNLSLFAFLLSGVNREQGSSAAFKVFHPSSMQVLSAQISVTGREQITVDDKQHDTWALDVSLAGNTLHMWIDEDGRLLKDQEGGGRMVVELIGQ